jgi:hypothetical protein
MLHAYVVAILWLEWPCRCTAGAGAEAGCHLQSARRLLYTRGPAACMAACRPEARTAQARGRRGCVKGEGSGAPPNSAGPWETPWRRIASGCVRFRHCVGGAHPAWRVVVPSALWQAPAATSHSRATERAVHESRCHVPRTVSDTVHCRGR